MTHEYCPEIGTHPCREVLTLENKLAAALLQKDAVMDEQRKLRWELNGVKEQLDASNRLNDEYRGALESIAITTTMDAERIKRYAQTVLDRKATERPKGLPEVKPVCMELNHWGHGDVFECGLPLPCPTHKRKDEGPGHKCDVCGLLKQDTFETCRDCYMKE